MAVTRQKNKKWKVDLSDGYDAITGGQKRHRKTNFKSRKEAERYEADYRINKLHQVGHKDKVSVSYLYSLVKEEDELRGNKEGLSTVKNLIIGCTSLSILKMLI